MKIRAMYVEGFGVWHRLGLEGFQDGLNLIYGPNEAGKTTLLEFVRSILYGFTSAWGSFLPPLRPGGAGGWLEVACPDGLFRIQRLVDEEELSGLGLSGSQGPLAPQQELFGPAGRSSARLGQLQILGPHGIVEEGTRLASWLGGVDETIYQNIFAIGLREIQQLALLDKTEAATLLYALSAGVDRVSLLQVMRELREARNRLLAPGQQPCRLGDLLTQREKLRHQIQLARQTVSQYPQLLARRDQLDHQAHQLHNELSQLHQQMRLVETAIAVRDRLIRRAQLDAQLAALPAGKPVYAEMLQEFNTLQEAIQEHQHELATLRSQHAQLQQQIASMEVNRQILGQSASIRALVEQLPWLQSLEERLGGLQEEIGLLETKLAEQSDQIGLQEGEWIGELSRALADGSQGRWWDRLREPAGRIRQLRRQLQEANQQAAAARQTAEALQEQLQQALAERGYQDLRTALEQTGQLLAQLRRRQQIDYQLAQIQRHQAELADQVQRLRDRPTRPIGEQIAWIVLLGLGMALVIWGAILPGVGVGSWHFWWAGLGLLFSLGSVLGTLWLQHQRRRQQQTYYHQRKMLQRQAAQLAEEREALEATIPPGPGSLAERIDALQQELALLEQLSPLDTRREAAWQEVSAAEAFLQQCQEQLQAAYQRWQETLQILGLPKLSPTQVRRLQAQADRLADLHARLQQCRHQYAQSQQQWETLRKRIRQLAEQLGLQPAHLNPVELLHLMEQRLKAEESLLRQRRDLRRQLRAVEEEYRRVHQQWSRLVRQRRRLFRQAGVATEEAFRRRAAQTQQAELLEHQRQALQGEIEAALSGRLREEDLAPYLQADVDLTTQQHQLAERIAELTAQLQACHEQRGQLAAQLRQLVEDRTLAQLRFQWDQLERQIAQASHRWQVLALTSHLLDELRRRYERQYQPETLQEASEYFRRMSAGRYQRIWRPLDQETLWVDLAEGGSLPVERLSHGTRELLYLSLRLALVAAYARRGIRLPMILDDVMVNFDSIRAQATAELLRDFALQGHQILLFTCHQHLQQLFQSLGVPQATLPDWSQRSIPKIRLQIPIPDNKKKEKILAGAPKPKRETPSEEGNLQKSPSGSEPPSFWPEAAPAPGTLDNQPIGQELMQEKTSLSSERQKAQNVQLESVLPEHEENFQWYETLAEDEPPDEQEDPTAPNHPLNTPLMEDFASGSAPPAKSKGSSRPNEQEEQIEKQITTNLRKGPEPGEKSTSVHSKEAEAA